MKDLRPSLPHLCPRDGSHVLVLACGEAKLSAPTPVPAIDLYSSRQFALARTMRAAGWEVLILSAEHGLIGADHPIVSYDRKMDKARAAEFGADDFQAHVLHAWTSEARQVVFYGGETYYRAFEALTSKLGLTQAGRECECVNIIGAGCGDHFSVLKAIARETGALH